MSKKRGVKKGSAQALEYKAQKEQDKVIEGIRHTQYMEQRTMDIITIVLGETFGFGPERMKRFRDSYKRIDSEIRDSEKEDAKSDVDGNKLDHALNGSYSRKQLEDRLERICGKHYQPRSERYSYTIMRDGKVLVDMQAED